MFLDKMEKQGCNAIGYPVTQEGAYAINVNQVNTIKSVLNIPSNVTFQDIGGLSALADILTLESSGVEVNWGK